MKTFFIIGIIALTLFSCKKDKTYQPFAEKQLVFVNYTKDQSLKFIDTTSAIQTLTQNQFRREYREEIGLYGRTGKLFEEYEVSYYPPNNGDIDLQVTTVANLPFVDLVFASYRTSARLDSLSYTFPTLTINGKEYAEVYKLKVYKYGQPINNDTATLFHNKQYGFIQLLFPNGKKIVRVD